MALRPVPLVLLAALLVPALPACNTPLLDSPAKVRHREVFLPPLFTYSDSPDGTSYDWNALVWLAGQDVEAQRRHTRVLPFYWHDEDPPYSSNTLWFPFWYQRDGVHETARFWSILYGYEETEQLRTDYVVLPLFYSQRSRTQDYYRSGLLFVYDWRHEGETNDWSLIPVLGLASLLKVESGRPADGETVPALGRESSRRFEVLNLLGLISLFGYDDVGDRREIRALTFFSDEMLSPLRSWRGRGDDPFVREWLFPLYMNVQDEADGWYYVGPLWGQIREGRELADGEAAAAPVAAAAGAEAGTSEGAAPATGVATAPRVTDWWLLGLLSHTTAPEGDTWRICGIPVSGP